MSLNRFECIGNLGRDPEIRSLQSGDKVCNLSVGVTERWKNKSGEKQQRTEWVRAVLFGKLADIAGEYLSKGSKVYLSGKLVTRKWQDQSGADKYSTEIVLSGFDGTLEMLDSPRDQERSTSPVNDPAQQGPHGGGGAGFSDDLDSDSIPFASVFI
jgi:single-strand DNA-binding protein